MSFELTGSPRLSIELERGDGCVVDGEFVPLRLPDRVRVQLGGLLQLLDGTDSSIEVELADGAHEIPLGALGALALEIAEGGRARANLKLQPGPTSASLSALTVRLDPPVRLLNVLELLRSALVASGPVGAAMEALRAALPPQLTALVDSLLESTNSALVVELAELEVCPREDGDRLQLRLTGALRVLEQLSLPLQGLPVPALLLPRLSATLATLLQQLRVPQRVSLGPRSQPNNPRLQGLALQLWRSANVQLDTSVRLPPCTVETTACDGTRTEARLALSDPLQLAGALMLAPEGNGLSVECPQLELRSPAGVATIKATAAPPAGLQIELTAGSALPDLELSFERTHPLVTGAAKGKLVLGETRASGSTTLVRSPSGLRVLTTEPLRASATALEQSCIEIVEGDRELRTTVSGDLALEAHRATDRWHIAATCDAELTHAIRAQVTPVAELSLEQGSIEGQARSTLRARVQSTIASDEQGPRLELGGSSAVLELHTAVARMDRCELSLPAGTRFSGAIQRGGFDSAGLQPCDVDLQWDLRGEPCLLECREGKTGGKRTVSLLTPVLRRGQITLHLSENGQLTFSGEPEGLYGQRYFNALLDPASDLLEWYQILTSDDAFAHIEATVSLFSPGGAQLLADARQILLTAREIARRERIRQPGDLIPRETLARFLSLLLAGKPDLQQEILPLIRHVTDGHGLALSSVKRLLERELGEVASSYTVGALLNLLDLILRPGAPTGVATTEEEPPLALSPAHLPQLAELPSARELYRAVESPSPAPEIVQKVAEIAPLLAAEQLDYLLRHANADRWGVDCIARVQLVHQLKRRVATVAEAYGGIAHAAQPFAIAVFLGDALGMPGSAAGRRETSRPPTPAQQGRSGPGTPAQQGRSGPGTPAQQGRSGPGTPAQQGRSGPGTRCALGPEEIATLLQAGLATARQGRRAQLNNRLLLEELRRSPLDLTHAVLVELGQQSPRALSGILYALLEQDQDKLTEPLDLPQLLGEKLGVEVPRQADFLAGGRRARESYYESLSLLADRIIAGADEYLARKQHLQQVRHPVSAPPRVHERELDERARAAVRAADDAGRACDFRRAEQASWALARSAHEEAFARCAELLQREPSAFQLPWLKRFWGRNEEALRVLSVVRAHQRDVDRVRHWLAVRSGRDAVGSEQALLRAIIQALYYSPQDRKRLLADPLVRLLIEPPPGEYDFTVISCMGVVTDGADGAELEHAYRRLAEGRGIEIVRAPTSTGRPLEDNARRIVDAIADCRTPWGIIGYSQGCANALLAESILRGGTPEQQRLLDGLVCRNLLFTSSNGSAHGTSGMLKLSRAMVAGERLLKHFQASYSWEAIGTVLRGLRAALDAPLFISVLGGTHSLSFERARDLHRDGQFLDSVPTSSTRTVVTEDRLPEVLEHTYHMLKELSSDAEQDTQVLLTDAIASATRVANDYTRAFSRCDMGALPQATHHWAPVTREVQIVTTERDRKLAIYESPTDQLVWPWIEVNARFGRIRRR